MSVEVRKRLEAIRDEVEDLHPLLLELLPKLEDVERVEYTHGPNEMGADFILARRDKALKTTKHVGVIAKLGKVLQDHREVDRQIEECRVPRFIEGGKKEIYLGEVWVIATGRISQGAQRKLRSKYQATNVTFVEGQQLAHWIDEHLPGYAVGLSPVAEAYLRQAADQNRVAEHRMSLVPSPEIYLEPDLVAARESNYRTTDRRKKQRDRRVSPIELVSRERLVIVEGGMGAGKSRMIRRLVSHFTEHETFGATHQLPIPASYKELIESYDGSIQHMIDSKVPAALREEIEKDGEYLLLIDGVDERRQSVTELVSAIGSLADQVQENRKLRLLLTSRSLEAIWKLEPTKKYARYEFASVTMSRVIKFLDAICSNLNLRSRLLEDLKRSPLFKSLAASPIAAILLAELLNQRSQELPSNITELYSKYCELVLGRWDVEKGLQSAREYEALDSIVAEIACFMLDNDLPSISIDEARGYFDRYLEARNLQVDPAVLFATLRDRCPIVVVDETRNTFQFSHRTFVEFFYARAHHRWHDLRVDARVFQPYWSTSYFFYIGLTRDCPDLLEEVLRQETSDELERLFKIVNVANYLLAGFASPYDVVRGGVAQMASEYASYYLAIARKRIESPLSAMPTMPLLWLFQYMFRDAYAYAFFGEAIESAALEIEDADKPDEEKAFATFFLNVALIESGATDSLDFLLQRFESLPFELQLACRFEGENLKSKTRLMRKQDKRLGKALRDHSGARDLLRSLIDLPIRNLKRLE